MDNEKKFDIDEGLKRLEEINQKLSETNLPLDDSIQLYKEGTLLAARCQEELTGVEKELEIVNQ